MNRMNRKRSANSALRGLMVSIMLLVGLGVFAKPVKGLVTDGNDTPLIGVTIIADKSKVGTSTDIDGKFSINLTEKDGSLKVSYIGYKTQTVKVAGETFVKIVLQEDSQTLAEVVVSGYGVMRKSDLTGSVASLKSGDIDNVPTVRVDQALGGKVSGVQVTATSGEPGAAPNILIRGGNSISAKNDPLFVIDGFIGAGDLSLIDPQDIESMEILKDAAATSIYGARGANGVVVITTKRGKEGKNDVQFSGYVGVQEISNRMPMLNAREYAELYNNQCVDRYNQEPGFDNPSIYTKGTDWQDEVLRLALMQNYQLSASGGMKGTQYYLSASYFNQDGVVKKSGIKRYQTRLNLDRKISERFKIGANFQFSYSVKNPNIVSLGGWDWTSSALATAPTMGIYNEDGSYCADSPSKVANSKIDHVVAQLNEKSREEQSTTAYLGIFAEGEILSGLRLKTSLSSNIGSGKTGIYNSSKLPSLEQKEIKGEAWLYQNQSYSVLWENTLNYMKEVAKGHNITALVGYTMQYGHDESLNMYGKNFTNDILKWNNISDSEQKSRTISSGASEWSIMSFLGRLNYSYLNRYIVTASARVDGSSRLGADNRFATFPSGAVAWRVSEEPFMKDVEWVNNLKLRTSYGLTGNQDIPLYQTLPLMQYSEVYLGDGNHAGYVPERLGNSKLKWETTAQFDIGLEASLFNNRLNFELDYYNKQTKDLLLNVELPYTSGLKNGYMNVGRVSNKGVELTIRSTNINTKDFTWTTEFNISHNRNIVESLGPDKDYEFTFRPGLGVNPMAWLKVGESVGAFYGYTVDGYYTTYKEIAEGPEPTAALGAFKRRDLNGDGKITSEDQGTIGDPNPDFYGGFSNTFTYKDFTLNIFMQYSVGNDVFRTSDMLYGTTDPFCLNQYKDVLDYWNLENRNSKYPRIGSRENYWPLSTYVYDGSYLKLKTLNLAYNLPVNRWAKNKVVKNCQIYVTATNLFTITKYPGYDPEVNTGSAGSWGDVAVNTIRGFDATAYPAARTYTFGLKITL